MRSGYLWLLAALVLIFAGIIWVSLDRSARPARSSLTTTDSRAKVDNPETQLPTAVIPDKATVFVPILMYHYIRVDNDPNDPLGVQLSVAPDTLDKQLALLAGAGYQTISLQDFVAKKYQPKSVILTFDDGYDDHFTSALPILQKYHDTATFFIISGFVGRPGYLSQNQVTALKSAGMEVGGHTITHPNLANLSYEKAILEVGTSMLSRDPVFAYPSGKYNLETLDIVSGLGIKAAVTTNLGVATDLSSVYQLPRIRVKEQTDLIKVINEEIAVAKRERPPSQVSKDSVE